MSYSYLSNQNWEDITREERFFCCELFIELRRNIAPFLKLLLAKKTISEQESNSNLWDVGYEVCFYRDLIYNFYHNEAHKLNWQIDIGKVADEHNLKALRKRTFDLCLFSENHIIIIEAKAQGGFNNKQMADFKNDIKLVKKLVGETVNVSLIGLTAEKYDPKNKTIENFKTILTWKQLHELYSNKHFLRAEAVFRK